MARNLRPTRLQIRVAAPLLMMGRRKAKRREVRKFFLKSNGKVDFVGVSLFCLGVSFFSVFYCLFKIGRSFTLVSFNLDDFDRGSYYDPSNIFCGQYDCYKILGFDYESWGKSPPNKKELTQSYRQMSKTWQYPGEAACREGRPFYLLRRGLGVRIVSDPPRP